MRVTGEKGCGKSVVVDHFSAHLNYGTPEVICCYKDMTSRDLLQRRRTDGSGNTRWDTAPLAAAALQGKLAVLDGVHRLTSDALSVISSLVKDREMHLPDGRRLLRHDRYDAIRRDNQFSEQQMAARGALRVHPSFRIVAVGTPPERENPWLTAEVLGIFSFVDTLEVTALQDKISILSHILPPGSPAEADMLSLLQHACRDLEALAGGDSSSPTNTIAPSCRQLLRLWRSSKSNMSRALSKFTVNSHEEWKREIVLDVNDKILRMFMVPFMPTSLRESFQSTLISHAEAMREDGDMLSASRVQASVQAQRPAGEVALHGVADAEGSGEAIQIGETVLNIVPPKHPELVPDTRFVSIAKHMDYLGSIAADVTSGERHLLLIGNQGTARHIVNLF